MAARKPSSIIADILSKRTAGVVHCGYMLESTSLPEVAVSFSLSPEPSNYRQVGKREALQILTRLLHKDMAYDSKLMPLRLATELSDSFLQPFDDESAAFFTNIDYSGEGQKLGKDSWAGPDWKPVTEATFDAGVIAIAGSLSACLWFEDEV